MRNIFLVVSEDFDYYHIKAAFSTLKIAKEFIRRSKVEGHVIYKVPVNTALNGYFRELKTPEVL